MRLQELITEDEYKEKDKVFYKDPFDYDDDEVNRHWDETALKTAEFIKQNCKLWLSLIRNPHDCVYRGFKDIRKDYLTFTKKVRNDRRPRDSSEEMHDLYNKMIDVCGKFADRDNSVFVSGSHAMASGYGNPYVIVPIGNFSYTWHEEVEDWYEGRERFWKELGTDPSMDRIEKNFCPLLKGDDGSYWKAVASGNEIMIACKQYLAINIRIYPFVAKHLSGQE